MTCDAWISVKKKLPVWGNYIVRLENNCVTEMHFSDLGETRWLKPGISFEHKDNKVTHYMPMPVFNE